MSEKTEPPTPKKLRDARNKGQVAMSKDVVSTASLVLLCAFLGVMWDSHVSRLMAMVAMPSEFIGSDFDVTLGAVLDRIVRDLVEISLPVLAIVIAGTIASSYAQIGALFTFETMKPELKKVNPVEGAKKLFSMKNLFELVKSTLKVGIIGGLIYFVIETSIEPLLKIPYSGIGGIMMVLPAVVFRLVLFTLVAYAALAAADFSFQKFQHTKELKMSKDEVKREYKESEGDPEIKGKRKQLHREILEDSTVQNTKKATVLVTNPTHRAVALFYEEGETSLPIVAAKGADQVAVRMIAVAEDAGIPVMRNVPLARALFDTSALHGYIDRDLIEPVAEVLRWVRDLGSFESGEVDFTEGNTDGWVKV
ncbi:MAG: type III secretion system export apparatus subunit SctU [Verrucomicrobiota bacterium]